jgi:SNF2 family DNA or RNA helicase
VTRSPISFEHVAVPAVKPTRDRWEFYFSNYLFNPALFSKDMDRQQRVFDTLAGDIGVRSPLAPKLLEALEPKVKPLRRWIGLQKVGSVAPLVRGELAAGLYDKIVLFGVHQNTLNELREVLREFLPIVLYAGTPVAKRGAVVKKFRDDPRCRVLCCQITAAGTAVDLSCAAEIGVVEADWSLPNNVQAVLRVWFKQQTRAVRVRFFGLAGTVEEQIQRMYMSRTRAALVSEFDAVEGRAEKIIDPFSD